MALAVAPLWRTAAQMLGRCADLFGRLVLLYLKLTAETEGARYLVVISLGHRHYAR